jgi:hypothetical protein
VRIATIAVVVALCLSVVAACGGASHATVTARITGGTPRERALARAILERISPSPVTRVRFMGLQHDAIHHWPGRRMDVTGRRTFVGASWEEYVFAYSYALLARVHHIPIGFVSLDLGYGSLDNALANAPRTPIDDSALHAYESKLRSAAKAAHASISFRELRPGPVALEATVTTKTPAVLLKNHLARFYDLWQHQPKGLFGFLFRVEDPTGAIDLAEGDSPGGTMGSGRFLGCATWGFNSSPDRRSGSSCPA